MQPAGCKTAIWFIYHQEALANQIRCTLKEGREGGGGGAVHRGPITAGRKWSRDSMEVVLNAFLSNLFHV